MQPKWDASSWLVYLAVLATGIGIGWLIGLSVSPVVVTLLSTITGAAAAVIAALGGLEKPVGSDEGSRFGFWRVNPLPLAALVAGIVAGSVFGLLARNYAWLGSDTAGEIAKWTRLGVAQEDVVDRLLEAKYPHLAFSTAYTATLNAEIDHWVALGMERSEVVQRLFDRRHPANIPPQTTDSWAVGPGDSPSVGTFLYGAESDACRELLTAVTTARVREDDQVLVTAFESSPDSRFQQVPAIIGDPSVLPRLVEEVLCANG